MEDRPAFLSGGGEVGALMRSKDWSATLGEPDAWPQSLRSVVGLMLTSRFPMFVTWGENRTFLYNDAYTQILGAKHPAALGRPFRDVWSEIWGDIEPLVRAAMEGNPSYHENLPLKMRRRGYEEQTWFTFSYSPVRGDDGMIAGMFCACTETTSQVLAEERRVKEIERQRRLFMQAPGFITVLSQPDHVFEFVNGSYIRLFGERKYIGRTVREVFPELEGQGFFEWLDTVYASGQRYVATSVPAQIRQSDGTDTERFLDFIYEPVVDENDQVTGIFCEGHDVTDAREARTALQENEVRLRDLNASLEQRVADALAERRVLAEVIETTDVFIQVVDADLRLLAVNKASADEFQRIFGVRPHAGESMSELLAAEPQHLAQVQEAWRRALAGEEYTTIEQFGDPGRIQRYYEMRFSTLRGTDGKQIGAYQFVTDVTERLQRESELSQAQEALRQSQKMDAIGQLTGGVAHDFNNLLTPIIGSMDLLQRKGLGDARTQRMIEGALQSAERARLLVQRLLAFARRQPLQAQPVDISALVLGMEDLLASTMGPRIRIVLHLAPDLPAAIADANQVEMALLNLAVNARDAMPDGGIFSIEVNTRLDGQLHTDLPSGPHLSIRVWDTGIGMDEATRLRATDPFFSTKGVGRGTGLGLSMVHGLAAQLGGSLTIDSSPGAGTTIEIRLPLASEKPPASGHRPEGPAVRGSGTVLLVDDEPLVRSTTADMLTDLGFAVIEAESAQEALLILNEVEDVQILVTDHLMPEMTGTELAQVAKSKKPGLAVLVISGYAEAEGVDPSLSRLTKPFRQAETFGSAGGTNETFAARAMTPTRISRDENKRNTPENCSFLIELRVDAALDVSTGKEMI